MASSCIDPNPEGPGNAAPELGENSCRHNRAARPTPLAASELLGAVQPQHQFHFTLDIQIDYDDHIIQQGPTSCQAFQENKWRACAVDAQIEKKTISHKRKAFVKHVLSNETRTFKS